MQALRVACRKGATRVTGRLPFDVRVEDAVAGLGRAVLPGRDPDRPGVEHDPHRRSAWLLQRIAPELEARLARSQRPGGAGRSGSAERSRRQCSR